VISVKNEKGTLLPGMTATVQFTTASADNVLTVPNAALRITPTAEMLKDAGITPRTTAPATGTSAAGKSGSANWTGATRGGSHTPQSALWYVGADKKLHRERVTAGLSDGQKTAVQAPDIQDGTQVVIAVTPDQAAAGQASGSAAASNPFQPSRSPMGGGRPAGR
jgi:HlyD family secretion protein